jgi:predicted nucleotidyltransferase
MIYKDSSISAIMSFHLVRIGVFGSVVRGANMADSDKKRIKDIKNSYTT